MANEIVKGIESQGSFNVELYTVADAFVDAKTAPHNMDAKRIFTKEDDRRELLRISLEFASFSLCYIGGE